MGVLLDTASGREENTATLEKDLSVSYKIKYTSTYEPAITILNIYPRETKTCPHKGSDTHVLGRFIHNSQQLEMAQLSINRTTDKQVWYNHTTEHYSATKRNKLQIHAAISVNLKNIMLIKRSPMLSDSIYMRF